MPRAVLAALLAALLATPLAAPAARAQFDAPGLTGTAVVTLGLGAARQRVEGSTVVRPEANTVLLGVARLAYWFRPTWALDLSAAQFGPASDGAITPLLLGAAWYPDPEGRASRVRPFAGASAGLFIRSLRGGAGATLIGTRAPARTDAVPGARLSAGADVFVGRRFTLGVLTGYHAAARFEAAEPRLGGTAARPTGFMAAATVGLVLPRSQ